MQRPRQGETEEDILFQQRKFLSSGGQPAARLVTCAMGSSDSDKFQRKDVVDLTAFAHGTEPPHKRSKFKEERFNLTDQEAEEALDTHDCHITRLLADVVKERDVTDVITSEPVGAQHGFPSVVAIGSNCKTSKSSKSRNKKSLFALHFEQSGGLEFGVTHSVLTPSVGIVNSQSASNVVLKDMEIECNSMASRQPITGEDMAKIHEENLQRLGGMSPEEITSEQAQLEQTLGPGLVDFLRKREQKERIQRTPGNQLKGGGNEKQRAEKESQEDVPSVSTSAHAELHRRLPTETGELQGLASKHAYVHMDKAELEKLEWMADITDRTDGDKDITVRFGLDGSLIPRNADLPVSLGLHHHGDDPQAAGYSLEELFSMVRSSVTQQKVLALQTLAKIVTKAWCGAFVELIKGNLLQNLVDAGLPVLLRLSLDEPVEPIRLATIECLHALLVEFHMEDVMDIVACTASGLSVPSLQVTRSSEDTDSCNPGKQTDLEVIQQDLILGLVRMDLLPRLRYLLEVFHLPPLAVISVVEILIRIARHSTETAHQIVDCSRLLDTVVGHFLPCSWRNSETWPTKDVYGMPLPQAVKLICVLCAAGRGVTTKLVSRTSVVSAVMSYITRTPSQMDLPHTEALLLAIHSYRALQACTTYAVATLCVSDIYPILMQRLMELSPVLGQVLPMLGSESGNMSSTSVYLYCAILGLVEACVHVGAITADQLQPRKNGNEVELAAPAFSWHQVAGMIDPIKLAVKSLGQRLKHQELEKLQDGVLLLLCGCLFDVLSAYYSHFSSIALSMNVVDCLTELEDLLQTVLLPIINGHLFNGCVKLMVSVLSSSEPYYSVLSHISVRTLPSLLSSPVVPPASQVLKAQQWLGLHSFVAAICRLSYYIGQVHKGCSLKVAHSICSSQAVIDYLETQLGSDLAPSVSCNKKLVSGIKYLLVKLFLQACENSSVGSVHHLLSPYHLTALDLLAKLQPGDEHIIHNLISEVIFRPEFFLKGNDVSSLATDLADLSVGSYSTPLQPITITGDSRLLKSRSLLVDSTENLPGIRQLILSTLMKLVGKRQVDQSRALACGRLFDVVSLMAPPCEAVIMATDWMFHPIVAVHNKAEKQPGNAALSGEDVSAVCHTLRLLLLLEQLRPEAMCRVSVTTRFTRLLCVFLAGNDLFLHDVVHVYMTALLRCYTKPATLSKIDFSESIPGVLSFYDLYSAVLYQYAAVSYGDPLFGCFVLLPLQQCFSSQFRRAVWGEHAAVLRSLAIPLDQIPVPVENFLLPHEADMELLSLYSRALFTGQIRKQWSPLMYLVAVHHLNTYLFLNSIENTEHHSTLMNSLCLVQEEDTYRHIVMFAGIDVSIQLGFKVHDSIPASKADRIRKFLSDNNNDRVTQIVTLRTPGL